MRVAIVCGSPSSEFMAPYHDHEVEIWVLGNRAHRHLDKRITRIFEIHDNLTEHGDVIAYAEALVKLNYPLITGTAFKGAYQKHKQVQVYPYAAVEALYGSLYLTSSPAYMVAYAILEGATEIGLYGVDLSVSDHEYFWQRPCMEAWIGFAKGRGITVIIPEVSHVGKSDYCEGRDHNNKKSKGVFSQEGFTAMAEQHTQRMAEIQEQRRQLALQAASYDGAVQVYRQLAKVARSVEANIPIASLLETTVLR